MSEKAGKESQCIVSRPGPGSDPPFGSDWESGRDRWIFVRKKNEQNEIVRYKARLVAQGFSQRHEIDYEEMYSPVMDATTFRYLIYLAVSEGLDMRLIDVVTTYLYGSIDTNVYMKSPERFKLPKVMNSKPQSMYSIKLQRSLYGLK